MQRTDMTLSYKVGGKILECRRTDKKEKSKEFSHTTAVVTIVQKKSALFPQLNEAKGITYQVGVPFLGQSRACETTVSFHALYVLWSGIPIKNGIRREYFSPGELPRRL